MSVTAPLGFRAAGVAAGLKQSGQPDVAVVLNDGPSRSAAAVFTGNRVQAAPVTWTPPGGQRRPGPRRGAQLRRGQRLHRAARLPGHARHRRAPGRRHRCTIRAGEIAVCSTGLIGERLPMDKLLPGVDAAVADASRAGGLAAADAIRTTDTVVKIAFRRPDGYSIGGMAKGAGMLAPGLATMLCVLTTDADLDAGPARRRAPVGHRGDLRPARHRRLHVHQRHGAADGQRGVRGDPGPGRVHPGCSPRCARTWPGSSSWTPRAPTR